MNAENSSSAAPLRVGVAGLGTVGVGVIKILRAHRRSFEMRLGRPVEVSAVSARSRGKDRGVDLSGPDWENDPVALARRDDVDLFVEVIGGSDGPALAATEAALTRGAHVVTANKAMMAMHGARLAALAEENGAALKFEAGVAGGVPIVKGLSEGLAANAISRIYGVLNGTCNYILTEMERTGRDYADILADAQALGYAEADPSADVGGWDAAHKLTLLSSLAFGTTPDFSAVSVEGIEQVSLPDIKFARELGYCIKLIGIAELTPEGLDQRVCPALLPQNSAIGALDGVTNAVVCEGDFIGQAVFEGPGAGEGPTASAVVADILDVGRLGATPVFGWPAAALRAPAAPPSGAHTSRYYLRVSLDDRPGALAQIAGALAEYGVSIDQMRQLGRAPDPATVLIVTHEASGEALQKAAQAMAGLDVSLAKPVALRIEQA